MIERTVLLNDPMYLNLRILIIESSLYNKDFPYICICRDILLLLRLALSAEDNPDSYDLTLESIHITII